MDSEDEDESTSQRKGKKCSKKPRDKTVMTVEGSGTPSTGKKAKAEAPCKEAAACTAYREAAATEKVGKGDGSYCKIQRTKGHDLQECYQVEQLVKKKRAKYDKRDKEKGQNAAGGKGRGGEENHPRKPFRNQGKPARGQEKEICDDSSDEGNEEETSEQEF